MKTVIVGHRGTGKSEFLKRLRTYQRDEKSTFLDLDLEIEKKIGKGIRELFLEHGEAYFREMERQVFLELLQRPFENITIVLGAGFDLSVIPDSVKVLWLRRQTDKDGRIFLNRPRLDPELSPLQEFFQRFIKREEYFKKRADEIYFMPEGLFENHHLAMSVEKDIVLHQIKDFKAGMTIMPEMFRSDQTWSWFRSRYASAGFDFFELRDDLLSSEQIQKALTDLSQQKIIFSLRKGSYDGTYYESAFFRGIQSQVQWIDWAWELGSPAEILKKISSEMLILSLHEMADFEQASVWSERVGHFKFAPLIGNFGDLQRFHHWQRSQPSKHSFLPRSDDGRWAWYRLLQKGFQFINFIKEGDGSAPDQPSLWQWGMTPFQPKAFAAVLGDPVYHSHTPMEHSDFFHKINLPVLAVKIQRDEWVSAFSVIRELGLLCAAVTAPHKENAARILGSELSALNTLLWKADKNVYVGTSTDEKGFLELIEGVGMLSPLQKDIVVWGGGGTLQMLKNNLPHAHFFSSRTGLPRDGQQGDSAFQPKVLIWAAPREVQTVLPPDHWKPAMVYDLNYKEDSLGKEYAQACGANYQSGYVMFVRQAQEQRVFWRQELSS